MGFDNGVSILFAPFGGLVSEYNKNVRDRVMWRALWCLKDKVHTAPLGGIAANCGGEQCGCGSG